MSADVVDDLSLTRAEFERWRSHASGRGRIPAHLWAQALALVEQHGVSSVCRELGLNAGRVRARLAEQPTPPKRRTTKPAFVELRPVDIARAAHSATAADHAGVGLQIDRADGTRLTLTLPLGHVEIIAELWAAFLRP